MNQAEQIGERKGLDIGRQHELPVPGHCARGVAASALEHDGVCSRAQRPQPLALGEDEIDDRTDLLAEELHGILAGAGIGLPVDVAGVVARRVGTVILEVHGGAGDDVLRGANAADELYGGAGDDVLLGGKGPDHLEGPSDTCR